MKKTLQGGCLCGSVSYCVSGEPQRFYHCHCSRCRQASGTGHASNVLVQGSLDWVSGEALVGSYKVPDAERFRNVFCSNCGAPLPRESKARGMVVIPAGSLSVDPGISPEARIFWDSRTDWSCSDDPLPAFAEYPNG